MQNTEEQTADGESHAFVVRMRRDGPPDPILQPNSEAAVMRQGLGRLIVRVEHVNRSESSSHSTIESALRWLRDRMVALTGGRDQTNGPPPKGTH